MRTAGAASHLDPFEQTAGFRERLEQLAGDEADDVEVVHVEELEHEAAHAGGRPSA